MRLLHVSNFHSPYGGSFVPMVRAALRLGLERGLRAEAVFLDDARGRPWLDEIEADGIPVRLIREGGLAELLAEDDGAAILHAHFSLLQIESARVARARPGTRGTTGRSAGAGSWSSTRWRGCAGSAP